MITSPSVLLLLSVPGYSCRLFSNDLFSCSCYTPNLLQDIDFEGVEEIFRKTSKFSCYFSKLLQVDWILIKLIPLSCYIRWLSLLYMMIESCCISLHSYEHCLEILLDLLLESESMYRFKSSLYYIPVTSLNSM